MTPTMTEFLTNAGIIMGAAVLATAIIALWPKKKPTPTPPSAAPAVTTPDPTPTATQSDASKELSSLLNQKPTRVQSIVDLLHTSTPE